MEGESKVSRTFAEGYSEEREINIPVKRELKRGEEESLHEHRRAVGTEGAQPRFIRPGSVRSSRL